MNRLVREYLVALVETPSRRRIARTRWSKMFETGLVDVGDREWSRNDLYVPRECSQAPGLEQAIATGRVAGTVGRMGARALEHAPAH